MKTINVTISGEALLMSSPKAMLDEQNKPQVSSKVKKVYDNTVEAEKRAYRTPDGKLFIPNTAIKGAILKASRLKKVGKLSVAPIIAGCTRIRPFEILLTPQKYEIDLRTVCVVNKRIVRARPCIKNWRVSFEIIYDESIISSGVILECLTDAGQRVGLLDFRPSSGGEFGCFTVDKFVEAKK